MNGKYNSFNIIDNMYDNIIYIDFTCKFTKSKYKKIIPINNNEIYNIDNIIKSIQGYADIKEYIINSIILECLDTNKKQVLYSNEK